MKSIKTNQVVSIVLFISFQLMAIYSVAQITNPGNNHIEDKFELVKQSASGVEINFTIGKFSITKNVVGDETLDQIIFNNHYLPNKAGAPDLPVLGRLIAIPKNSKVSVNYTILQKEIITGLDLIPTPQILIRDNSDELKYQKDWSIYSQDKLYPNDPIVISEVSKLRGIDYVVLSISPFQYNPVTKELFVYSEVNIKLSFIGENDKFGEDRLRNKWWDPILAQMLLNYESLPEIENQNISSNNGKETGAEYLIITPNGNEFQQWADSIKTFRTTQGILTTVVTLEDIGGNTVLNIENYINDAYFTWDIPPVAILCLGDYGTDAEISVISPIWQNYCLADNMYSDVDGDDLPDMIVARMCAQNATELETMVSKFINYERIPPENLSFYDQPITSSFFNVYRWSQLLTESIAGFYEVSLDKNTNRINVGPDPLPEEWSLAPNSQGLITYFGPDGLGYIPATPEEVNCSWNSNAQDVIDGINSGAFMLLHDANGFEQGWSQPEFNTGDINGLINPDLTFVWSINCLNGKFDIPGDCFAEKFHRHTSGSNNSGALGVVSASEISYSFLNEVYAWGAFDNMWPDFLPDFGTTPSSNGILPGFANAAGKYFLYQSSWPYNTGNKIVTYNIFHYFGDAFSTIYTEMPQELEVSHASWLLAGETSFEITANEGSLIALSANNELIGVAEGTGEPVEIQIQPQTQPGQMLVTVTKQNYYRYGNMVPVITTTAYNEQKATDEIIVYPNPSQGKLSILCNENYETVNITVLNVLSKIVFKASSLKVNNNPLLIDLENQSKGIYYFIISSGSRTAIKKVLIH